ncbi:hypothetical protein EA472_19800 [Natrarchaeobius oligotrophus]|uniref:Uncharacterized protein n=1 Tax=Natrarchaeobius chitinivorans TaxID=1679083 RepID=A0A3N6PC37_NATCH|nr:hypothetical protein EA472_19800 [Natrarchaeobius chitinivorans]
MRTVRDRPLPAREREVRVRSDLERRIRRSVGSIRLEARGRVASEGEDRDRERSIRRVPSVGTLGAILVLAVRSTGSALPARPETTESTSFVMSSRHRRPGIARPSRCPTIRRRRRLHSRRVPRTPDRFEARRRPDSSLDRRVGDPRA